MCSVFKGDATRLVISFPGNQGIDPFRVWEIEAHISFWTSQSHRLVSLIRRAVSAPPEICPTFNKNLVTLRKRVVNLPHFGPISNEDLTKQLFSSGPRRSMDFWQGMLYVQGIG